MAVYLVLFITPLVLCQAVFWSRSQFIVPETLKSCTPGGKLFLLNGCSYKLGRLIVHPKMKILAAFTRPHAVPNSHDFLFFCATQQNILQSFQTKLTHGYQAHKCTNKYYKRIKNKSGPYNLCARSEDFEL